MLNEYLTIARHLDKYMPELAWIERDKGQIENEEEFNSILTPGVLLDFGTITWQGIGRGDQIGDGSITVKLIFVKPPATHVDAVLQEYEPMAQMADKLHLTISKLRSVKERRNSSDYFTEHWYIIEQTYDVVLSYEVPTFIKPKPRPEIQGELLTNLNIPNQ